MSGPRHAWQELPGKASTATPRPATVPRGPPQEPILRAAGHGSVPACPPVSNVFTTSPRSGLPAVNFYLFMKNSPNSTNPHYGPGRPAANSLSPTSQVIASSHPPQPALAPGESRQNHRQKALEDKLRSHYPELRRHYSESQEAARLFEWGSPWPDHRLANLDLLFAEKAVKQSPETPSVKGDAPDSLCSLGKSDACLYSLPSLANPRAMPTLPPPARLTFDLYEDKQYYPNLNDCPPPRAITF
jgi:hypothetical protein